MTAKAGEIGALLHTATNSLGGAFARNFAPDDADENTAATAEAAIAAARQRATRVSARLH